MLTQPLPQVSVMNFLLVLLWTFAMPYCRFRHMASCLSTVWTCIIIVCKMLYQLKIVNPSEYSSNCTQVPTQPHSWGVCGGFPSWRWGLVVGRRVLTPGCVPSAAPAQCYQLEPRGTGQLHVVPWPRGPCQLVRHPQGLPQPGLHPGGRRDTLSMGTTWGDAW